MKAKLLYTQHNGRNLSEQKELIAVWNLVTYDPKAYPRLQVPATVRCWSPRSNRGYTVFATLWVRRAERLETSGFGRTSGWGYDHYGPAATEAFRSAGIELTNDLGHECEINSSDGVPEALLAVAEMLGYSRDLCLVTKDA